MREVITDYSARIFDGDRDYHWMVRPCGDDPDGMIELVYVEDGKDRDTIPLAHDVARKVAEAITDIIGLNTKPPSKLSKQEMLELAMRSPAVPYQRRDAQIMAVAHGEDNAR